MPATTPGCIDRSAVIRLFDNNGFDYELRGAESHFIYEQPDGQSMDFICTWLTSDPLAEYPLNSVRAYMTNLLKSAKKEEKISELKADADEIKKISDSLIQHGLVYDDADEMYYYVENGKALFGVDIDYMLSLKVEYENRTHESISYDELVDIMHADAVAGTKKNK